MHKIKKLKADPNAWYYLLLYGPSGGGKSSAADIIAMALAEAPHAIERLNGQSTRVDVVRDWQRNACYRSMFGHFSFLLL